MMYRGKLLFIAFFAPLAVQAQWRGVVVNVESGVPERDVLIFTDRGESTVSGWDGRFCLSDTLLSRLTLSHPKYVTRQMSAQELADGDTICLIPLEGYLGEVEVWGKKTDVNKAFKLDKTELQLQQPVPQGFNVLGPLLWLIDKILPQRHKETKEEKLKRILDEY